MGKCYYSEVFPFVKFDETERIFNQRDRNCLPYQKTFSLENNKKVAKFLTITFAYRYFFHAIFYLVLHHGILETAATSR